jgi:two-component system phosphate regulon sensor histidine kinase PhoR
MTPPRQPERRVPKIQLKLTAVLAALVAVVVTVTGLLAERSLRHRETARIARTLEENALLVKERAEGIRFETAGAPALDAIADRAGAILGARVTLIARDGSVIADSDVSLEELDSLANHAGRPEVRAALAGAVGTSKRRSATVGRSLFYLALPLDPELDGIVRLAVDLSDMEAAIAELRRELLIAGGVGLAAAIALGFGLSWFTLRPIEELRRVTASIARGDLERRVPRWDVEELGDIADAINRMGEQLRLRLEEVTREKEQLQAVLNGMVEGVLVVDAEGKIVLANTRLREFFEAPLAVEGRLPLEIFRNAALDEILKSAAQSDEPVSQVISVGGAMPRILSVHAVAFPAGGRERLGTVAGFDDITELTRLEQVRRDFVANASHELRTPLTAIRGFAETLRHGEALTDEERRSYVEVIDRHSHRLSSLVDDLLELSSLESGEAQLHRSRVDPAGIARSLIRDWGPRFAEKSLRVSLDDSGSALVWADPRALEQILTNLLDNAIKYTDPGGRIDVGISGNGNRVEISVRDDGIGIPDEDRDRIFERFYRVDKARSRALGGTGLGLSIVKHLVQKLGGQISVESVVGGGSTFAFTLPPAPATG